MKSWMRLLRGWKTDLPLEEAFKLYQEGVKLLKYCNGAIDKVEKKIIEIHGNEDEEDE